MVARRRMSVKRAAYLFPIVLAVLIAGCGGTSVGVNTGPPGEVSGVVFDVNGNIVRNADVFTDSPSNDTVSNSNGSYILHDVPAVDIVVRAQVSQNGTTYIGQNLARVFSNDRARNVNIVVVPQNQIAQIHGTVFDSHGDVVAGARVFATGTNHLSSNMAVADSNGNYSIHRLAPGIQYELNASTPDFQSDGTNVTLNAGDDLREDFTLTATNGVGALPPPANLAVVAWTSPDDSTRSIDSSSAYEQIKRLYDPKRAQRTATTRLTPFGDIVEADLTWDRVVNDFLLGYNVYVANGSTGNLQQDDFLRDPLAEYYADNNGFLNEDSTYSFALSSVNSSGNEGNLSNRVTVTTLGPMIASDPTRSPLTFHWQSVFGATGYIVYLFDQEPRIGVDSIWDNSASPATGTSVVYSGPALTFGKSYYFVVLGVNSSNTSRTISPVMSFTD